MHRAVISAPTLDLGCFAWTTTVPMLDLDYVTRTTTLLAQNLNCFACTTSAPTREQLCLR